MHPEPPPTATGLDAETPAFAPAGAEPAHGRRSARATAAFDLPDSQELLQQEGGA